jgi:hypothetical protein
VDELLLALAQVDPSTESFLEREIKLDCFFERLPTDIMGASLTSFNLDLSILIDLIFVGERCVGCGSVSCKVFCCSFDFLDLKRSEAFSAAALNIKRPDGDLTFELVELVGAVCEVVCFDF